MKKIILATFLTLTVVSLTGCPHHVETSYGQMDSTNHKQSKP